MTTPAVHRWKSAEYVQEWVLVLLPSLLSEARTLASLRRRLASGERRLWRPTRRGESRVCDRRIRARGVRIPRLRAVQKLQRSLHKTRRAGKFLCFAQGVGEPWDTRNDNDTL